ncbi:MAG: DUF1566 domain-containing protein [Betaproteobacteria bacterium]|nr:DUF1566 domain-containing protein [Betaproteobacteria bacterium]
MAQLLPHMQGLDRPILLALAATVLAFPGMAARAVEVNDTGQTLCHSSTGAVVPCAGGQDGRYGRDAAAAAGALPKTGAGVAGFDYTKIANNGSDLAVSATLGSNQTDWACTRDNLTDLTWEVKTSGVTDLRYSGHTYTWYSTAANNGGTVGNLGTNTCNGTLALYANQCNTANYVLAVNAAALCGHGDWRLPSLKELQSLANSSAGNPAIDATYFSNTQGNFYWSASNYAAGSGNAWYVDFSVGGANAGLKSTGHNVRLVRGGN